MIYEIKNVIHRKSFEKKLDEAWLIGHRVSAYIPFEIGNRAVFFNQAFTYNEFVTKKIKEILYLKNTVIIITTKAIYFLEI